MSQQSESDFLLYLYLELDGGYDGDFGGDDAVNAQVRKSTSQ